MTGWFLWGALLLVQNASFTWVSRARNSRSLAYHAIASIASNGIWFLSLGIAVNKVAEAQASGSWGLFAGTALFYTAFTVAGSVGAHHFLMTRIETGARKVG
jgi:hypothetical protein